MKNPITHINFLCPNCEDRGVIKSFFKKAEPCPVCNGNPSEYRKSLKKDIPPPAQPPSLPMTPQTIPMPPVKPPKSEDDKIYKVTRQQLSDFITECVQEHKRHFDLSPEHIRLLVSYICMQVGHLHFLKSLGDNDKILDEIKQKLDKKEK